MNTFVLTPAAEDDLTKIAARLEGERSSAVVRVLGALEDAMQLLADNPGIGHVRPDLTPLPVRFEVLSLLTGLVRSAPAVRASWCTTGSSAAVVEMERAIKTLKLNGFIVNAR